MFLFTLENQIIHEVTESQYEIWEATIPPERRTPLGMLIRRDVVGRCTIVTWFSGTPLGDEYDGDVLLFGTIASGDGIWEIRRHVSLEDADRGHERLVEAIELSKDQERLR